MAPYIVHELPYLDTRDLNLDWLFKHMKAIEKRQDELEEMIKNIDLECLVKVEDYGAVGDGETDDTEAIQKCINENPNATIFFRRGRYNISDTIYLYDEVGGQQIILGGAIINWDGVYDDNKAMFSITKHAEGVTNELSSCCRILGGNFEGNKRVGYCLEQYSYYGIVDGCKMKGFNRAGLFVGKIAGYAQGETPKSLQAKHNNLLIYQTEGNFSAENTSAVIITAPDSEYSQIITNRTKVGFELRAGGNSFVNCHTTIQFQDPEAVTPEMYNATKNIWINVSASGSTQQNTFQGCYFNMGKYVVYSQIASRYCVNLDSCFYIWYTANHDHFKLLWQKQVEETDPAYPIPDIPDQDHERGLYIPVYICGGKASDFRCNNIDILVGDRCCVMDYFPESQPSSVVPLPDMVKINSNDRHPEAPVWSAWNMQPENTLTPLCSSGNVIETNVWYEVGAIMLCYNGIRTSSPFTSPVKVRGYLGAGVTEVIIGFNPDEEQEPRLHPYVMDFHNTTDFNQTFFAIDEDPTDIEIEGIIYPTYKIYMQIEALGYIPRFLTMENDSPFMKTYVRAQAVSERVRGNSNDLLILPVQSSTHRKILFVGDSYGVTYNTVPGWGTNLKPILENQGWEVGNHCVGGAGFVALGGSGSDRNFQKIVEDYMDATFTDVLIAGGANDRSYTTADIKSAIAACVAKIREINPKVNIFIGMVAHHKTAAEEALIETVSYPAYYEGALESNVIYLANSEQALTLDDIGGADGTDPVHPTAAGNVKLGNLLYQMLFNNNLPVVKNEAPVGLKFTGFSYNLPSSVTIQPKETYISTISVNLNLPEFKDKDIIIIGVTSPLAGSFIYWPSITNVQHVNSSGVCSVSVVAIVYNQSSNAQTLMNISGPLYVAESI